MGTKIVGTGSYLPERIVENDELAALIDTSHEWIVSRTGIHRRRFAAPGESTSDLALHASLAALADAKLNAEEIDMILFATLSPDVFFPGSGVFLGAKLGVPGCPAMDIRNQCSGFLYAMHTADALISAGAHQRVLLVGAEVHSTGLDLSDRGRDIAVLFGDGAGAVVLEAAEIEGELSSRVITTELGADGRYAESLWCEYPASRQHPHRITEEDVRAGRHFPQMSGRVVFKHAVKTLSRITIEMLDGYGLKPTDVALYLPHQANQRINDAVAKRVGIPPERVWSNIAEYGNTTAATIPICLDEAKRQGKLTRGDLVCSLAFGSGFTWGVTLFRY